MTNNKEIKVTLDWDAAREHVEEYMLQAVRAHEEGLQRYIDKRGMDEAKNYLSTDYFDATGYRYWVLTEYAEGYDREGVVEAMRRVMVAHIAQANIFGEIEANNAFEDWKVGNHDT